MFNNSGETLPMPVNGTPQDYEAYLNQEHLRKEVVKFYKNDELFLEVTFFGENIEKQVADYFIANIDLLLRGCDVVIGDLDWTAYIKEINHKLDSRKKSKYKNRLWNIVALVEGGTVGYFYGVDGYTVLEWGFWAGIIPLCMILGFLLSKLK